MRNARGPTASTTERPTPGQSASRCFQKLRVSTKKTGTLEFQIQEVLFQHDIGTKTRHVISKVYVHSGFKDWRGEGDCATRVLLPVLHQPDMEPCCGVSGRFWNLRGTLDARLRPHQNMRRHSVGKSGQFITRFVRRHLRYSVFKQCI